MQRLLLFPLYGVTLLKAPNSSHHHSEYWQMMDGFEAPEQLYAAEYRDAVNAVTDYVNSEHATPPPVWDQMNKFMANVSLQSIGGVEDIMFNASVWGAIDVLLTGIRNVLGLRPEVCSPPPPALGIYDVAYG
jgi:hypothetical protein